MTGGARLLLFSLVSMTTYTAAYYFNWALFRLDVTTGRIGFLQPTPNDQATISWYGWIATAVLIGAVVAWLTPARLARRIPADAAWLVPVVLFAALALYEKRWFL